jgi:hypothetical protein
MIVEYILDNIVDISVIMAVAGLIYKYFKSKFDNTDLYLLKLEIQIGIQSNIGTDYIKDLAHTYINKYNANGRILDLINKYLVDNGEKPLHVLRGRYDD